MTPFFSIIIPVYNVEPYLRECLDSVRAQTFTDWEAICVDDGSTDNSGAILDEYAEKDKRFKIIHQKNAGVSVARNVALQLIQGKWLSFLDADDLWAENFIEKLICMAENNKVDLAICGVLRFGGIKGDTYIGPTRDGMFTPEDLYVKYNSLCAWSCGKIYKRKLWDNIRFPEGIAYSEDRYVLHRILYAFPKVFFVSGELYQYRQRNNSAYGTSWKPAMSQRHLALIEQIKFFERNNYHRAELFTAGLYLTWVGFDLRMLSKIKETEEFNLHILENEYKEIVFKYWNDFVDIRRKEDWNIFPTLGEMWISIKMLISRRERLSFWEYYIILLKYDGINMFLKRIIKKVNKHLDL